VSSLIGNATGFNLAFHAVPVDGKVVLRPYELKEETSH
jgi:hypothetical protein